MKLYQKEYKLDNKSQVDGKQVNLASTIWILRQNPYRLLR